MIAWSKIKKDLDIAITYHTRWKREGLDDLRMQLGEQWVDPVTGEDKREKLQKDGKFALTLNYIDVNCQLIDGYQRENRNDIRAFAEGEEDNLMVEIINKGLDYLIKRAELVDTLDIAFQEGIAIGKSVVEPYRDYSKDILRGELKFEVTDPFNLLIDPKSIRLDLTDARFIIKRSKVTKDDLKRLLPDKADVIEGLGRMKEISTEEVEPTQVHHSEEELIDAYAPTSTSVREGESGGEVEKEEFELIEYHYKTVKIKWFAVNSTTEEVQEVESKEAGMMFIAENPEYDRLIAREAVEIRLAYAVDGQVLEDTLSPFYPEWKEYPFFPFFAYYTPLAKKALKRDDLAYRGLVRKLKDAQREINKQRSQALNIINSVAQSGYFVEEDTFVDEKSAKRSAGLAKFIEIKKGKQFPQPIAPPPVPGAQVLFERQSKENIKEISGINADLLAMTDKTVSGRAIAFRQRQGLIILRPIFNNFSKMKKRIGSFLLSQLPEFVPPKKMIKVLGKAYIVKNFAEGNEEMLKDEVWSETVVLDKIRQIYKDIAEWKYDVVISVGLENPTMKYLIVGEIESLMQQGIPIPPQVRIKYSALPEGVQKEILGYLEAAQQAQMQGGGK